MYLSKVQIKNFRNFNFLDVSLSSNSVIVGETRVGKSNFLYALRLVLDNSLPDAARQLKMTDFWDFCTEESPTIEIHIDFSEFDSDPNLMALLTDYRLAENHEVARLSYVYRKKADLDGLPKSEIDYEYKTFGGGDETKNLSSQVRRRIYLALLPALRDAEAELGSWHTSPLHFLLDEAIDKIPKEEKERVATEVAASTSQITDLESIKTLETTLKSKMGDLSGHAQDIQAKLGVVPTDPLRLFRSIRLLIDNGKRGISEASLGSANLALLTLKLAEFEWLREKNDHNFTIMCIEEPESHIHPHLQRTVFKKLFEQIRGQNVSLFLTTHSPILASVTPLSSIVVLKQENNMGTQAYALAELEITDTEKDDLQRYLDSSRAEILFSKKVIFVEGISESILIPIYAHSLGIDLDELGISICNVGGTNFVPYVRFACALSLPFCVITDWDPVPNETPLGQNRLIGILDVVGKSGGKLYTEDEKNGFKLDATLLKDEAKSHGIFTNNDTFETEISDDSKTAPILLDVLDDQNFGVIRQKRIASWKSGEAEIDTEQLLAMVADIGKGRLASRLAEKSIDLEPPAYIKSALEFITQNA
jgi:putative ATP-dependent endonuclease of the OLD family